MASGVRCFSGALAVFCSKRLAVIKRTEIANVSQDEKKPPTMLDVPIPDSPDITCLETSPSGSLLSVCTDNKKLYVWNTNTMDVLCERSISKRAVLLSFTHAEDEVLVADKAGDVWSFNLKNLESEAKLILGHVSMLLDMVMTADDRFVITSDRDEKIRVSHFPNSYNIHCFCLGHTELVSKLCICPANERWLISGSADGTVILWDYTTGEIIYQIAFPGNPVITGLAFSQEVGVVVLSHDKSPCLFCYCVSERGELTECGKYDTDAEICHFEFDPDNQLWVVLGSDVKPLLCLKWYSDELKPVNTHIYRDVLMAVQHSDVFRDVTSTIPNYSELKKRDFDNVAQYLQRKEERAKDEECMRKD